MIGRKKRVRKMINMNFGENPMKGNIFYDAGNRIDKVSRYHNLNGEKNSLLDDITWDDLEMEQVFFRINHTNSFIGEQMLFHKLHDLNNIEETHMDKFEQHLSYLSENPKKI